MTIIIAAYFTRNEGQPATGLNPAEVSLYLTRVHKVTGVDTVIWNGIQATTEEVDNVGSYLRIYSGEDLTLYDYFVSAQYVGAVVLDTPWSLSYVYSNVAVGAGFFYETDVFSHELESFVFSHDLEAEIYSIPT